MMRGRCTAAQQEPSCSSQIVVVMIFCVQYIWYLIQEYHEYLGQESFETPLLRIFHSSVFVKWSRQVYSTLLCVEHWSWGWILPVKPQGLLKKSDIALKTMLTIDMTIDECSVIIFQVLQMISVFLLSQTCFASNLSVKQKDKKVLTKKFHTNKQIY